MMIHNLYASIRNIGRCIALVVVLCTAASVAQAPNDERVALIIGNSRYPGRLALKNPANDAAAMSSALKELGFKVIELKDGTRAQMEAAVQELFGALKGKRGVGLLYYAGHGIQVDWRNFLVPVDAALTSAREISTKTVEVAEVLDALRAAGSRTNIVILDACRDNPFLETGGKGLAPIDAPAGTFLAYATAPGNVAEDGSGENGLYTKHLLSEIRRADSIENVFKRVRLNVRKESQGRQVPWESTSLEEDFFFDRQVIATALTAAQRDNDYAEQRARWDKIKASRDPEDFYAFLARYPSGLLSEIARYRLEQFAATTVQVQPHRDEAQQAKLDDRLRVGDEWSTTETDSMGSSRDQHTYKVTRAIGELVEVKRGMLASFYYTKAGAYAGLDQPFVPKVMYDPPIPMIPMGQFQVGYKASSRSDNLRSGKSVGVFDAHLHVVARERINTPLGSFEAYKVEVRTVAIGAMGDATETIFTRWFKADSAIPVREVIEIPSVGRRITKETTSIKRGA